MNINLCVKLFTHHPTIECRRIRPYNDDGSKMTLNDVADCLWQVLQDYRGGLLLIEDINKYVSATIYLSWCCDYNDELL